jgi:hypothetical protein
MGARWEASLGPSVPGRDSDSRVRPCALRARRTTVRPIRPIRPIPGRLAREVIYLHPELLKVLTA